MPKNKSWWRLYCGNEFITFLGFKPQVKEVVKLDELHEIYQVTKVNENHIAYGQLMKNKLINIKN